MAVYPNKLDPRTLIDISETLDEMQKQYGRFNNSGLFRKEGITTQDFGFNYNPATQSKMTGATSRLGRKAWKVSGEKKKRATLSGASYKLTDAVQYEDLAFRVNNWQDLNPAARETTVAEAVAEKLQLMNRTMEQDQEYSVFTAMQGVQRDAEDGEPLIDMYTTLGVTRLTETIDLTQPTGLRSQLSALVKKIKLAQVYGSGFSGVEVVVADDVFDNIAAHPEIIAFYEAAFNGRGSEYINSPWLNGRVNDLNRTLFGYVRTLVIDGITFTTYSENFVRWDGTEVEAVASGKGFTVLQGVAGLYQAKFSPAPYISLLGTKGQENYVWQTPIKDDTHFEIYQESHGAYFMQQPELSVDITFTLP